jgi:hypothetical protein
LLVEIITEFDDCLYKKQSAVNKKLYILAFGDTHAGAVTCLLNPETTLSSEPINGQPNTWKVALNEYQRVLWDDVWMTNLTKCREIIKDAPVVVIHGGDVLHGNLLMDQLLNGCARMANQEAIAVKVFDPLKELNIQRVFLAHGTELHGQLWGGAEENIAVKLRGIYGWDTVATPAAVIDCGGCRVDLAHHGPPAGRMWNTGNVALTYLKGAVYDEIMEGNTPPDLYLRHHYHVWVNVAHNQQHHGADHWHGLLVIPSLCGPTGHARRVTRSQPYMTVGFALIEIDGGRVTAIHRMTKTLDAREMYAVPLDNAGVNAHAYRGTPRPNHKGRPKKVVQ